MPKNTQREIKQESEIELPETIEIEQDNDPEIGELTKQPHSNHSQVKSEKIRYPNADSLYD